MDQMDDLSSDEEVVVFKGWIGAKKMSKAEHTEEPRSRIEVAAMADDGEVERADAGMNRLKSNGVAGMEKEEIDEASTQEKDGGSETEAPEALEIKSEEEVGDEESQHESVWWHSETFYAEPESRPWDTDHYRGLLAEDRRESALGWKVLRKSTKIGRDAIPIAPQCTAPHEEPERPVSEPPNFNYDRFEREAIPSDKRFNLLFPDSIGKRTQHKDLLIEHELLGMYGDCIYDTVNSSAPELQTKEFLLSLHQEIRLDEDDVNAELEALYATNTDALAKWEFDYLDNDGETTRIQRELQNRDIFGDCEAAREKYGHLGPTNLERFEERYFLPDDTIKTFMVRHCFDLKDLFKTQSGQHAEVRKKYGFLNSPNLEAWEAMYLDDDGDTRWIREQLKGMFTPIFKGCPEAEVKYGNILSELERWESRWPCRYGGTGHESLKLFMLSHNFSLSADIFSGYPEAEAKYSYLLAPNLEQWEWLYLNEDGGTYWIRGQLLNGQDVFKGQDEAKEKYKHLIPTNLEKWEHRHITTPDYIQEQLLSEGDDYWKDCDEAKQKYGHLAPTELERWEYNYLEKAQTVLRSLKPEYRDMPGIFDNCPEAKRKYEHLQKRSRLVMADPPFQRSAKSPAVAPNPMNPEGLLYMHSLMESRLE